MADCSRTEVFFSELERMCSKFYSNKCTGCKLEHKTTGKNLMCYDYCRQYSKEAIEKVQQWSDSNPIKTRQSEFLKLFPNVLKDYKTIQIDPCVVEQGYKPSQGCSNISCLQCKEEYWLAEVK